LHREKPWGRSSVAADAQMPSPLQQTPGRQSVQRRSDCVRARSLCPADAAIAILLRETQFEVGNPPLKLDLPKVRQGAD